MNRPTQTQTLDHDSPTALPAPNSAIPVNFKDPSLYFNRELSHLQFQHRVLDLARSPEVPLLNRLAFLCISCSNLDEFFEVRVAGLKRQKLLGISTTTRDSTELASPKEQLELIRTHAHSLVDEQYQVLREIIIPSLSTQGIHISRRSEWTSEQRHWVHAHFHSELLPILSPLALDPGHPFPRVLNKGLNFIVALEGKDAYGRSGELAIVSAPRALPRLIKLPADIATHPTEIIFLSSVIHENVDALFPGMQIKGCYQFRLTRNSDLFLDEEDMDDLLNAVEGELFSRRYGDCVRLEVADDCPARLVDYLTNVFHLSEGDVYRVDGPVNPVRLLNITDMVNRPDLEYPPFTPKVPRALLQNESIFDIVGRQDLLLHHPYESFSPVIDLVQQAATDPQVVAIKITLYRAGASSILVDLLVQAARAGKEVTAVIELLARFDEEANIQLANRLQEVGAQVVYGVVGFKTHAKMLLIVRREKDRLRYYAHLGTGNYHARNARQYTDMGLITSRQDIGQDVHRLFLQLTGLSKKNSLTTLLQSPFTLLPALLNFIARETAHARTGKKGLIMAKINACTHRDVIEALYEASSAGVEIRLIVRGICCLRPGLPGVSENIKVISVLGRFLEHLRLYYFHNDGQEEIWLSSADWMERNLNHRVECCFPIQQPELKKRVLQEGFEVCWRESAYGWLLQSDGEYSKIESADGAPCSAQEELLSAMKTTSA